MKQFVIAGLGNPGPQYQWTRHNAGFLFLDCLAHLENLSITKKAFSGISGEWRHADNRITLLKPETFMNLSGRSVMQALQFFKLPTSNLLVVHDDLDLPFGTVRLKLGGGHGGHNGLRSIMEQLGKADFIRLRIGVGRAVHGDTVNYVLGTIPPDQMERVADVLGGGVTMLKSFFEHGLPKTMSLYNNRNFLEG